MNYSFANFQILGHLGSKPVVKDRVMFLSIAKNVAWTNKETNQKETRVKWNKVTVFDTNPQFKWLSANLKKGDLVFTEGTIEDTEYIQNGVTKYETVRIGHEVNLIPRGADNRDTQK